MAVISFSSFQENFRFLLCKSQGTEPSFLRFLLFSLCFTLFLPRKTKIRPLQFLAVPFFNCFCFTVPIKNRTLLLATEPRLSCILLFHSKIVIANLFYAHFLGQGINERRTIKTELPFSQQNRSMPNQVTFISCGAATPQSSGSEATPREWKARVSSQ